MAEVSPGAASVPDPRPRVGRFPLLRRIGAGGVGVVYEAYDEALGRGVAVKMLQRRDPVATERLLREAEALARVAHPNVVPVFEVGEHEGSVFVVMELVRGSSLRDWLKEKPDWRQIVRVFVEAGRGLQAAHDQGIVHRDFKPSNVVIGEDGRARVLDFGLVQMERRDGRAQRRLTGAGQAVGTPFYMSPEQIRGEEVGPASDQFAFCAGLFHCLFGLRPFGEGSFGDIRARVLAGRLETPPRSAVPERVTRAVVRGLATRPGDRHPSMRELLDELEAAVGPSNDADVVRRSLVAAMSILLLMSVISAVSTWGHAPEWYTRERFARLTVLGLFAYVVIGVVFRRGLLATAAGRRAAALYTVAWVGMASHRLLMLWFETPLADGLVGEATNLGLLFAVGGVIVERWVAWGALFAWAWALLVTSRPELAGPTFSMLLASIVALGAISWSRPPRARGAAGSGETKGGR